MALAAVLFVVSWDMSEKQHLAAMLRHGLLKYPTIIAFLTLALTVFTDLTTAVAVGTVLGLLPAAHNLADALASWVAEWRATRLATWPLPDPQPRPRLYNPAQ